MLDAIPVAGVLLPEPLRLLRREQPPKTARASSSPETLAGYPLSQAAYAPLTAGVSRRAAEQGKDRVHTAAEGGVELE